MDGPIGIDIPERELFNPFSRIDAVVTELTQNIKSQLSRNYLSKDYYGRAKPVLGGDFGSLHPKNYTGGLRDKVRVTADFSDEVYKAYSEAASNIPATSVSRRGRPKKTQSLQQLQTEAGYKSLVKFTIDFGNADYWYYVNYGRIPGQEYMKTKQGPQPRDARGRFMKKTKYKSWTKMPPLKNIQQWVETKPALLNAELDVETRTYLAMRSIARDGIYGIRFVENAVLETMVDLENAANLFSMAWFRQALINEGLTVESKKPGRGNFRTNEYNLDITNLV